MLHVEPAQGAGARSGDNGPMHDTTDADKGGDANAESTPYAQLGGEAGVRALVDRFYDTMQLEARFAELRAMHPGDLGGSRDKLHWFLCGWLGGPALYEQRFGHPRLRMRHFPYAIGTRERDAWIDCMRQAMDESGLAADLQARLLAAFTGTADWMRNQPDAPA